MMAQKTSPILFNAEMINAILVGKKHQTRRVIKPQPDHSDISLCPHNIGDVLCVREPVEYMSINFAPNLAGCILLTVTNKFVNRINDISIDDMLAEGLSKITKDNGLTYKYGMADADGYPGTDDYGWEWNEWETAPEMAFKKLWDSIYADKGYGWDENPFVWGITFKVDKQ